MRSSLFSVVVGSAFALTPLIGSAQTIDLTGDVTNRPGKVVGSFEGTFKVVSFALQDGEILVRGVVNGVTKNRAGKAVHEIVDRLVEIPVADLDVIDVPETEQTCDILHLELGPLDLNLLGLVVHLDQVVLDIDADPEGGLLGELLCSIADGLDFGAGLDIIVDLLNDVLDALEV